MTELQAILPLVGTAVTVGSAAFGLAYWLGGLSAKLETVALTGQLALEKQHNVYLSEKLALAQREIDIVTKKLDAAETKFASFEPHTPSDRKQITVGELHEIRVDLSSARQASNSTSTILSGVSSFFGANPTYERPTAVEPINPRPGSKLIYRTVDPTKKSP